MTRHCQTAARIQEGDHGGDGVSGYHAGGKKAEGSGAGTGGNMEKQRKACGLDEEGLEGSEDEEEGNREVVSEKSEEEKELRGG